MLRGYTNEWPNPGTRWKGMTTGAQTKRPNEVLYSINNHASDNGWEGRRGFLRLANVNGINPVNGLFQYRQPPGLVGDTRVVIACADDKSAPNTGGYVCSMANDGSGKTQLNGSLVIPTGLQAKWRATMVHGALYMCNGGHSALYRYDAGASSVFAEVEPVDGFSGDTSRPCLLDLPICKVLGAYKSRVVIGGLYAGSGPYATTGPLPYSVEAAGPRMLFMSEPITDVTPDFVVQVKEFFIFDTGNEEVLVNQREYNGQNVCFLSDSTHELIGDIASEYRRRIINGSIGMAAAGSLQETPIGMIWLSKGGFVLYNGQEIREISPEIKRIFTQYYGSYVLNPYLIDTGKLWNATSQYDPVNSEYTCWLPLAGYDGNLVGFTYNLETKGWYIGRGVGSILDTSTGYRTTKEKGYCAEVASPTELDNNEPKLLFGDKDGFVCMESADGRDAYIEYLAVQFGTTAKVSINTAVYTYLGSTAADDLFNGAKLVIVDDRTAVERAAGTFPTGRLSGGDWRTVTDTAYTVGTGYLDLTLSAVFSQQPQVGCVFALYWPIRSRVIDEVYGDNVKTVKRINSITYHVAGSSATTLSLAYQGDPTKVSADEAITEMTAQRSKVLSGDNVSAFQEVKFNLSGREATGRKFCLRVETLGEQPAIIQKAVIEHQVLGDF